MKSIIKSVKKKERGKEGKEKKDKEERRVFTNNTQGRDKS